MTWPTRLLIAMSFTLALVACKDDVPVDATEVALEMQEYDVHTVVEGEYLARIARQYPNVSLESLIVTNEGSLTTNYETRCARFGADVRDNPERTGLVCNDRFNRPYANFIRPGDEIRIPRTSAPAAINQAVSSTDGEHIAIVIDDTGSMSDDMDLVAEWYAGAVNRYDRQLVGIFLYADGQIRHFQRSGEVEFATTGGYENTFGALLYARDNADHAPDTIILVTDEPGDDWDWSEVQNLPPVIANCLPEGGYHGCENNLSRLVHQTGGQFLRLTPQIN